MKKKEKRNDEFLKDTVRKGYFGNNFQRKVIISKFLGKQLLKTAYKKKYSKIIFSSIFRTITKNYIRLSKLGNKLQVFKGTPRYKNKLIFIDCQ